MRLIHLRRPVVLQPNEGPFVPPGADLDDVQRRWAALRAANPNYFDGRLWHVLGVSRNGCGGAVMHVVECAYRFHAVQDEMFDLGVRAIGVKGLARCAGRVLLGRRSAAVARYQGCWEFAPGGVLEPDRGPGEVVLAELDEETGLRPAREPVQVALLYDDVVRSWEIVFALDIDERRPGPRTGEYDALEWCAPGDLPAPLTPLAERMRGLV